MRYRTEFDFIVLFIRLHTRKIPFNAPVDLDSVDDFNYLSSYIATT